MINNVIIADDSSTARMIIKRCLEIAGCLNVKFFEANDGEQALEIAKQNQIALLLTDLNMPNMDGISLLKRVKSSPTLTDIPVIVISSASHPAKDSELTRLGALAVLSKPISPASLSMVLQNMTQENDWG